MGGVVAAILGIGLFTALAAKWAVAYHSNWSIARQTIVAALSFPAVTGVIVIAWAFAMVALKPADAHSGQYGMPIFALLFMWFTVAFFGMLVAVPTAVLAVRSFRG